MTGFIVNIDVDDLERGIEFYRRAVGLRLERRLFGGTVAEMGGGPSPIQLLGKEAGSLAGAGGSVRRTYGRHWTPVHLDFVVEDVAAALERARSAGAELEGDIEVHAWGRMATLSDPFGHGFCLLQLGGRGYGEVADRPRMDAAELGAAGLYDATAPNAADRLALLEWLASRGVTIEQMVEAERESSLTVLASDLTLRPGPRFTARDVARRHDLPLEQVLALSLAVGLPPRTADEPIYVEEDAALFASFANASQLFGEAPTRRFIRVVGSCLARIAEAAVALYQVNVEGPLRASGGSELDLATKNVRAIDLLGGVRAMLQSLLGGHMERATRRFRETRSRLSDDAVILGVGFVDLVGFTALAHRVSRSELAEVIGRFEDAAYDIAAARDGRVVKLVGDEVMFVTRDPAAACDVALTLVERFAGDPAVTPRGGLAHGELLQRGGDYYGPVVNLAARMAQIAVPNELLVTSELAAAARSSALRFEPAGKRMLKGFDDPVPLLTVARGRAV